VGVIVGVEVGVIVGVGDGVVEDIGVTVGDAVGEGAVDVTVVAVGVNESEQPARAIDPASRTMMNNNRDFIVLATPGFRD